MEISQKFVAFSEYMNFISITLVKCNFSLKVNFTKQYFVGSLGQTKINVILNQVAFTKCLYRVLTRNRPQIQLWCPRPKSNMYDFSVLSGSYVHVEATQEKELNSLHALKGIGKKERSGVICIMYL